jgi:hypothetical protein
MALTMVELSMPKAAGHDRLLMAGLVISRPSLAAVIQSRTVGVTGLEVVDLNKSTLSCQPLL